MTQIWDNEAYKANLEAELREKAQKWFKEKVIDANNGIIRAETESI